MAGLFILFISINILAFIAGHIFTDGIIELPKWLDVNPFNCRKCLTTHIAWVLNTLVGLIVGSWLYVVLGVIFAGIIYWLIRNEEKDQWE